MLSFPPLLNSVRKSFSAACSVPSPKEYSCWARRDGADTQELLEGGGLWHCFPAFWPYVSLFRGVSQHRIQSRPGQVDGWPRVFIRLCPLSYASLLNSSKYSLEKRVQKSHLQLAKKTPGTCTRSCKHNWYSFKDQWRHVAGTRERTNSCHGNLGSGKSWHPPPAQQAAEPTVLHGQQKEGFQWHKVHNLLR